MSVEVDCRQALFLLKWFISSNVVHNRDELIKSTGDLTVTKAFFACKALLFLEILFLMPRRLSRAQSIAH